MKIAAKYGKPVVLEEFGFPRDGFQFSRESSTDARDVFYTYIFDQLGDMERENGTLAGCNFWAWGGFAQPSTEHVYWMVGDDYTGDPAQEEQGLNSVFSTDTTIPIIKQTNSRLKAIR